MSKRHVVIGSLWVVAIVLVLVVQRLRAPRAEAPPRANTTRTERAVPVRIDVDAGTPYAIPSDNPFVGQARRRGEIWAWGLRNPWRFSFDRETGELFIADVGQNDREEVNARPGDEGGVNYGWNVMEGSECFQDDDCDRTGLILPVVEYDHGEGCSITGGFVYRGSAMPELRGHYFFSDFCSGFVRSFRLAGGAAVEERSWPELEPGGSIPSFGEDADGELYLLTREGSVHKIAPRP